MSRTTFVAALTPAQEQAHRKIAALQKVYDAAREVLLAEEIWREHGDPLSEERFDDAIEGLHASVWNTAHELGQPYP